MSFPEARCAGGMLIYHWFTGKCNIPLTDGTLSDGKIASANVYVFKWQVYIYATGFGYCT